jgi:hypothetical protein
MKFFLRAKDLNCECSPRTNVSITEVYYLVMYIIFQLDIYVLVPQYVNIYDTMWPMSDSYTMNQLRTFFEEGFVSRESIDSTLISYNNSCAEMRSEARNAYIHKWMQ